MDKTNKEVEEDYDPYQHRNIQKPTSTFDTYVHFLKMSLGTGILALPYGFKYAGWVTSLIGFAIILVFCLHTIHIVFSVRYDICKHFKMPYVSYAEGMKLSIENGPAWIRRYGSASEIIVDISFVLLTIGILCVYAIFEASNLLDIWDYYLPECKIGIKMMLLMLFIPHCFIVLIPNLKILSPFGVVANIVMGVALGCILYYTLQGLPNLIQERNMYGSLLGIPIFYGTAMFSLMGLADYVVLEANMENPRSFVKPFGVLNVCLFSITCLYCFVGLVGYWKYGDDIKASITLSTPQHEILSQVIRVTFVVSIFVTFACTAFVCYDIIWECHLKSILERKGKENLIIWEMFLRIVIITIVILLSIAVPLLNIVISFVGTFAMGIIGFMFPPLMEIFWNYPNYGKRNYILVKDCLILLIGLTAIASGTICCIRDAVMTSS